MKAPPSLSVSPYRRGGKSLYTKLALLSHEARIRRNIEAEFVLDPERVTKPPVRLRETDAGYDITACEKVVLRPGIRTRIPTGLRVKCPPGYFYEIRDRSSLTDAGLLGEAHIIDATYTGEIFVCVTNRSGSLYTVRPGERIAQLVFLPQIHVHVTQCKSFDPLPGERGDAGNGSSGRE